MGIAAQPLSSPQSPGLCKVFDPDNYRGQLHDDNFW